MNCALKFLFFLLCFPLSLSAQSWMVRSQIEGMNNETSSILEMTESGEQLIGGVFSNDISFQTINAESEGQDDIYLFKLDPQGQLDWALTGGSIIDDELQALGLDADGNLYLGGTYWFEANFGNFQLSNDIGKAIFILKLDPNGQIIWSKSLTGDGLRELSDLAVAENGDLVVTGFFSGQLSLNATQVLEASGDSDVFFARFSANGDLQWSQQGGGSSNTRGVALAYLPNGDIAASGIFDGTMDIDGSTIVSGSNDWDVFNLRLGQEDGSLQWLRRAGSVFDQFVRDLDVDMEGNIYITGSLSGVMNLSEDLSIQSSTINPDIFLVKYNAAGDPIWAFAFGGFQSEDAVSIDVFGQEITICGFHSGPFSISNIDIEYNGNIGGFAAGFDLDGNSLWGQGFTSNGSVFGDQITHAADGTAVFSGSFENSLSIGSSVVASDAFDVFVATRGMITSAIEPKALEVEITIFPNPVSDYCMVKGLSAEQSFELEVWNSSGQLMSRQKNNPIIDMSNLKIGYYLVKIVLSESIFVRPLVKK